jgi:hypothetical protein
MINPIRLGLIGADELIMVMVDLLLGVSSGDTQISVKPLVNKSGNYFPLNQWFNRNEIGD